MISKHLDKNNLHHAYLIEGEQEQIVVEILEFLKSVGVESTGNADVTHITLDSFKIDDARNLKSYAGEKGFSAGKKFFIVSTNNFLLEAQNTLLKMFEEPIENTHFFVVVPDASSLLKTFVSRFFLISPSRKDLAEELKDAERFIKMPLQKRIDFLKEFLAVDEVPTEVGIPTGVGKDLSAESARTKALKFLNSLESALQAKMSKVPFDTSCFHHIFKVREFLRMPGSSPKTLMESVAIVIPNF